MSRREEENPELAVYAGDGVWLDLKGNLLEKPDPTLPEYKENADLARYMAHQIVAADTEIKRWKNIATSLRRFFIKHQDTKYAIYDNIGITKVEGARYVLKSEEMADWMRTEYERQPELIQEIMLDIMQAGYAVKKDRLKTAGALKVIESFSKKQRMTPYARVAVTPRAAPIGQNAPTMIPVDGLYDDDGEFIDNEEEEGNP